MVLFCTHSHLFILCLHFVSALLSFEPQAMSQRMILASYPLILLFVFANCERQSSATIREYRNNQ